MKIKYKKGLVPSMQIASAILKKPYDKVKLREHQIVSGVLKNHSISYARDNNSFDIDNGTVSAIKERLAQ